MVHEIKGIPIVAKRVQSTFTDSLNEAYEGMGHIPRLYISTHLLSW